MKWFSGVNSHNKTLYQDYINMYKVAVFTAKETNPLITPYLILDGDIDDSINELIEMGVNVIQHRVSFSEKIDLQLLCASSSVKVCPEINFLNL